MYQNVIGKIKECKCFFRFVAHLGKLYTNKKIMLCKNYKMTTHTIDYNMIRKSEFIVYKQENNDLKKTKR